MPCVPKIDMPCPLDRSVQERLDGWCQHCEKRVHALDGLDSETRRNLLRRASGPICVSYRVASGLGAALAMSALAAASPATDVSNPFDTRSVAVLPIVETSPASDAPMSPLTTGVSTDMECDEFEQLERIEFIGGVSNPNSADWIELDSELPELPIVFESGTGES